jgi:hypothetical protein
MANGDGQLLEAVHIRDAVHLGSTYTPAPDGPDGTHLRPHIGVCSKRVN